MTIKSKINISIIAFVMLSVFVIVFFINPLDKEIQEASQKMIFEKQKLIALERKIKNIKDFRANYSKIKTNLEKIDELFINSEAPVDFISFLEKTSQVSQVPIDLSPSSVRKEGGDAWSSLGFRITSLCPFPNFLRFLEKLESSPYLITITNLNINALSEKEVESSKIEGIFFGYVKASLSIKIFAK